MSERCDVLIVDDDVENIEFLFDLLSKDYKVAVANDGAEGVRAARLLRPQVILMDVRMPGFDGISACAKLRADDWTRAARIIMVSACDDEEHRIESFRSGADDFVAKPFSTMELLARVQSKLRRVREYDMAGRPLAGVNVLVCGNLCLDLERMEASVAGRPCTLTLLEFQLIKFMVENRERALSRARILEAVWQDAVVTDRTVDTHVSSLRRKLAGFDHVFQTVHGVGYMLRKKTT